MQVLQPELLPAFCAKRILILGCGNRLFGDDGFGCAVAEHLQARYEIPDDVYVMDVGTGVRKLLFTLALSPALPELIILFDAVDKGRSPGELFEISLGEIPREKADDFSLHQAPSSNLAKDLEDRGVLFRVIACQVERIPEQIEEGLTAVVSDAVIRAAEQIAQELSFRALAALESDRSPVS